MLNGDGRGTSLRKKGKIAEAASGFNCSGYKVFSWILPSGSSLPIEQVLEKFKSEFVQHV